MPKTLEEQLAEARAERARLVRALTVKARPTTSPRSHAVASKDVPIGAPIVAYSAKPRDYAVRKVGVDDRRAGRVITCHPEHGTGASFRETQRILSRT